MFIVIKFAITIAAVILASEIARRNTLLGGFVAALPLVSLLAIVWLYVETGNGARVGALSRSIFWLVLPSLPLFLLLPALLETGMGFYRALFLSLLVMAAGYGVILVVLGRGALGG